ncbi:54S ribosomal protein L4 mitochondrial [Chytridiales sp. JEL 0842]|nr:54S ribosomal protein L4 mitochondrial [Chytridiales sp. JEL 0842]
MKTGRAWTCAELRTKSFEDLHKLWWVCIKEQNKLISQKDEAKRFKLLFPQQQKVRLSQVRQTMSNIKLVLWERKIAYQQSQAIFEREVKRLELIQEIKEYTRQQQQQATSGSPGIEGGVATVESQAQAEVEDVELTPEMERLVEAEMKRLFPIPVHLIGRPRAEAGYARKEARGGRTKKAFKNKKDKKKGGRWFVV